MYLSIYRQIKIVPTKIVPWKSVKMDPIFCLGHLTGDLDTLPYQV